MDLRPLPLLALLAAPSAAAAQTEVGWLAAPTLSETAAAYPPRAKAARVGGLAELTCSTNYDGWLRNCAVYAEQPGGYGFGTAAKRLAESFRAPRSNATIRGDDVRVRIAFRPEMLDAQDFIVQTAAWAALPGAADFQATFPKTANGVNSVRVAMTCAVTVGGALSGCVVDQEDPAGQGYGQGALALASKIRVGLWTPDGLPTVGAKVRVPIRYELTQASAPGK